jgi:tripartite-type tricarboxylate transporter receptor subunit TctC
MVRIKRRLLAAGLPALAIAGSARGQAWPDGPMRIVVPFAPGGSTDAVARLVSPGLQQRLGVPVVVENRSGAAGSIGTRIVAQAKPDGQTFLLTFDSHPLIPVLVASPGFDVMTDFAGVMLIGGAPYVVACRPDKPYADLAALVAAAKARGGLGFGSTGNGTLGHLVMAQLVARTGAPLNHVPYRSGGLAVNDAVAGHVEGMIGSAALIAPHVAGGSLRPLAQFGPTRLPGLATVPTAAENGFPGLEAEAWWGVFAPKGTPAAVVARMNAALAETLREARVSETMTGPNQARLVLSSPAELDAFVRQQAETWIPVARANNVQPD